MKIGSVCLPYEIGLAKETVAYMKTRKTAAEVMLLLQNIIASGRQAK